MNETSRNPKVSVVITCYNQARFLGESIASVLRQTYRYFEIIVVDDGSQDDAAKVASLYPEVRFNRQENQGVAAARNSGLCASRGKYVTFFDADDRLLPKALEIGVKCLESNSSAAFVYGQYRSIDIDGNASHTPLQLGVDKDHYRELLCRNYIGLPGMVMFRRDIFESVGGWDRQADHSSDWELYLRISKEHPIIGHQQPVVEYRQHGANTSQNHALMLTRCLAVLRTQLPHLRDKPELMAAYRTGVKNVREAYGEALFEQMRVHVRAGPGEWSAAWRDLMVLLRLYPRSIVLHTQKKIDIWRNAVRANGESR